MATCSLMMASRKTSEGHRENMAASVICQNITQLDNRFLCFFKVKKDNTVDNAGKRVKRMIKTRPPPEGRRMNTILLEIVFGRINRYKKEIENLSYDDMERRANKEKINYYGGKIEELEWIVGELMK